MAIGFAIECYARAAHAISAGIKFRHCRFPRCLLVEEATSSEINDIQNFWKTIKPFLIKKSCSGDTDIILWENVTDEVVTDEGNACEILNDYYVNIAKNIGIENEEDDIAQHQNVEYIANNHPQDTFQFDVVDEVKVYNKL